MQNRLILTRAEMPLPAFGLTIVKPAVGPALRTRPAHQVVMVQINMDISAFQLQLDTFNKPR